MSREDQDKCKHGWDGEHYQPRGGDSLKCVHEKNEVNHALDRTTGPGADSAGVQVFNNTVDAYRLFTGPKKVEEACDCKGSPSKSPEKK